MDSKVAFAFPSDRGRYWIQRKKIICNNYLEVVFNELKGVVSSETFLNYMNWKSGLILHIDAYEKQFGVIISQNNKPISLLSRLLYKK